MPTHENHRLGPLAAAGLFLFAATGAARAQPLLAPEAGLRNDLLWLADAGRLDVALGAWPLDAEALDSSTDGIAAAELDAPTLSALNRILDDPRFAADTNRFSRHLRIGFVDEPQRLRSFHDWPREEAELELGASWAGDRAFVNVNLVGLRDAEDDWRSDGSYVGWRFENWSLVAGSPERWWGPGQYSSLILSTNARPLDQIGLQRTASKPFSARWLRWIGPWNLVTFIGRFDDERVIDDALLFGMRITARPLPRLEIGLSRTAQWCGDGRPCDLDTFGRLLAGKDNKGTNVADEAEPGNQLAGFDLRWALENRPYAFYLQWIAEDTRQGGPQLGSWLRMVGAERSNVSRRGGWRRRLYVELADTTCQEGGTGFGSTKPGCGYQHGIFKTGYRFENRSLAHPADGDSQTLAIGAMLDGPGGNRWQLRAVRADINEHGTGTLPHSLSQTPVEYAELEAVHERPLRMGRLGLRLGVVRWRDEQTGETQRDVNAALQWWLGY